MLDAHYDRLELHAGKMEKANEMHEASTYLLDRLDDKLDKLCESIKYVLLLLAVLGAAEYAIRWT